MHNIEILLQPQLFWNIISQLRCFNSFGTVSSNWARTAFHISKISWKIFAIEVIQAVPKLDVQTKMGNSSDTSHKHWPETICFRDNFRRNWNFAWIFHFKFYITWYANFNWKSTGWHSFGTVPAYFLQTIVFSEPLVFRKNIKKPFTWVTT